jgi:hypothetical protein
MIDQTSVLLRPVPSPSASHERSGSGREADEMQRRPGQTVGALMLQTHPRDLGVHPDAVPVDPLAGLFAMLLDGVVMLDEEGVGAELVHDHGSILARLSRDLVGDPVRGLYLPREAFGHGEDGAALIWAGVRRRVVHDGPRHPLRHAQRRYRGGLGDGRQRTYRHQRAPARRSSLLLIPRRSTACPS